MAAHGPQFHVKKKFAGAYEIGGPLGLVISLEQRPIRLHRFMMRLCLGWVWVDADG